jgi:hypothetical protein
VKKAPINSFQLKTFIAKMEQLIVLHRFLRNRVVCDIPFSSYVKSNRYNSWSLKINTKSYCKYFMSYWRSVSWVWATTRNPVDYYLAVDNVIIVIL